MVSSQKNPLGHSASPHAIHVPSLQSGPAFFLGLGRLSTLCSFRSTAALAGFFGSPPQPSGSKTNIADSANLEVVPGAMLSAGAYQSSISMHEIPHTGRRSGTEQGVFWVANSRPTAGRATPATVVGRKVHDRPRWRERNPVPARVRCHCTVPWHRARAPGLQRAAPP